MQQILENRLMEGLLKESATFASAHHTGVRNVVQSDFFRVMRMDKAERPFEAFHQIRPNRRDSRFNWGVLVQERPQEKELALKAQLVSVGLFPRHTGKGG
jgi:hypothetical protein